MDGILVLLAMMVVCGIAIVPIWMLVMLHRIRNVQDEKATQAERRHLELMRHLEGLRQMVIGRKDAAAPAPPPLRPVAAEEKLQPVAPAPAPEPLQPPLTVVPPRLQPVVAPVPPIAKPAPPPPPHEPSEFERRAKVILQQMWNWIIIGAEHRTPGVSYEYAVATNWLLRVGIVGIVVGIGFFLKYSMDRGWLGPEARVAMAIVTGLVMLVLGIRMIGKQYHLIGQGLIGGGLATLYFSVYASANMYHLIGLYAAFGLMAFITFSSGVLAVRLNSLLVAILGIIGGYLTPVLLSTGVKNFPGLYGYLLVLGIGILGIAYYKRWYLLNYLAMIGTYALYFLANQKFYTSADFWQVFPFLVAFFALFSTITFMYCIARREKATLLELLALLVNSSILFGSGYHLINDAYGREWIAALTIGLTVFYIGHIYLFLYRKLIDRTLMLTFLALASFFLTMTLPLLLTNEWLTVSWALQGLVMLWLATRLGSNFLRWIAFVIYGIVLFRLGVWDMPRHFDAESINTLRTDTWQRYLGLLIERLLMFGVPIASFAGAWLVLRTAPADTRPVSANNDMPALITNSRLGSLLVWIGAVVLCVYAMFELHSGCGAFCEPFRLPSMTLALLVLAVAILAACIRGSSAFSVAVLLIIGLVVLFKFFVFDLASWSPSLIEQHYDTAYGATTVLMRLLDFGMLFLFFSTAARILGGTSGVGRKTTGALALMVALVLLFIYLTFETSSALSTYMPRMRAGGVSIVWALYALGLVLCGIWRSARWLRYPGLILFAIVAAKVCLSDLNHLDQLYRIIAFIVIGLLFMCGSLLYLKYQKLLGIAETKNKE